MEKPGAPISGWVDEDLIEECFQYSVKVIGPIHEPYIERFVCIIVDYLNKSSANKKGKLKQTKRTLEEARKKIHDLMGIIQQIKNDDSSVETMKTLEADNPSWFNEFGSLSIINDLEKSLDRSEGLFFHTLESLPQENRWKTELKPESDLIENMANFFQDMQGHSPRDFFRHDRSSGEYSGQFFDLIQAIFEVLDIEQSQSNESLGRAIDRALAKGQPKNKT
jgi:hypothetical protein